MTQKRVKFDVPVTEVNIYSNTEIIGAVSVDKLGRAYITLVKV
jgi:hypothetical protein